MRYERWILVLVAAALVLYTMLSLSTPDRPYTSPIKMAYALFDAPYTEEEYAWLAGHADLVVAYEFDTMRMAELKDGKQDLVLLMYKFSGLSNETRAIISARGFGSIFSKGWFLLDEDGKPITVDYNDFSRANSYYMDYSNLDWRAYAGQDYLDSLGKVWDGVFIDALFTSTVSYLPDNVGMDEAEYEAAVERYLQDMKQMLNSNGKLYVINGAPLIDLETNEWAGKSIENHYDAIWPLVDGIADESFVSNFHWGGSWRTAEDWEQQISAMEEAGRQHKLFIAVAHNPGLDRKAAIFSVASYLIGMSDTSYLMHMGLRGYSIETYKADYQAFSDIHNAPLGLPVGGRYLEGDDWVRDFENGKVTVNPRTHTAQIKVGGQILR